MKKKIIKLSIVVSFIILLLTLTGCGNNEKNANNSEDIGTNNDEKVSLYPIKDAETKKYGYVNTKGEWVIEPQYINAEGFDEETGLAKVKINSGVYGTGFINSDGEVVIEAKYGTGTSSFYNGYACLEVSSGGSSYSTYKLIDKDGNTIIDSGKYNKMTEVSDDGILGVVEGSGMKYIKLDGTVVIESNFGSSGRGFSECGLASVEKGVLKNAYKIIDKSGNYVSDNEFSNISKYSKSGYAFASKLGSDTETYGIIDKAGNFVVEPKYKNVYNTFNSNDLTVVKDTTTNLYSIINTKGECIKELNCKDCNQLLDGSWVVTLENGNHEILNADGTVMVSEF